MKLSAPEIEFLYAAVCFAAYTLGKLYSLYREEHPPEVERKIYKSKPSDYGPAVIHKQPMHGGDGTIAVGYPAYWDGTYRTVDDDDKNLLKNTSKTP
jgi:hypothetical protein